jgi:hypothetical protein
MSYEEWILDYQTAVACVSPNRVVFGSQAQARAWLAANPGCGGYKLYRRTCVVQLVDSEWAQAASAAVASTLPEMVTGPVNRIGVPNVPAGFVP